MNVVYESRVFFKTDTTLKKFFFDLLSIFYDRFSLLSFHLVSYADDQTS